ncbi:MAG: putative 2-keto-4-pentenoate hydratase [Herminiimonas sp.]|nr:putative 2-keto-4-pentenoate hydratase [Herminiimonas sp.]
MLLSAQANRYAHQLLDIRANSRQIPPLSTGASLSLSDGYDIAKNILDIRTAEGEVAVGRKIGFTNRTIWPKYGASQPISHPIWGPMYDTTVRYANNNLGIQSLLGAVQPRIEPEIVFKLGKTPGPDASLEAIADSIEWMAHGLEIVVSPFPEWKFDAADAVAAFGLHGALIVGEPKMLSAASRRSLAAVLASASVSISCGRGACFSLLGAGFGSYVLDSPVHALWHLHQLLQTQPQFAPLTAGEIITTGTWTDAYPIEPGQTLSTAFSGISLPGLTVSFV